MIEIREKDGKFQVVHKDGTTLFETSDRTKALVRASVLSEIADRRKGRATSEELLVLFPPTAPAPLVLGAMSLRDGLSREDVFDEPTGTWKMLNVEVFREGEAFKRKPDGTWVKLTFTADDVIGFVEAFAALGWQPPVKIDHGSDQRIVLEDLPSIARVVALRAGEVKGGSLALYADLERVPVALRDAIGQGKFPQRSIEFWRGVPRPGGDGSFPYTLKAVSLLGDELPAVRGMPPLDIAPAKFSTDSVETFRTHNPKEAPTVSDPAKNNAADVVTLTAEEYAKQKQSHEALKAENDRLKAAQDDLRKRTERLEIDRRIESATTLAARSRESGKITPAQEPVVLELIKGLDDEKKDAVALTVTDKNGAKEENLSIRAAFLKFLDSLTVSAMAPGKPGTRGDKVGGTGVASYSTLSIEEGTALVAKLGDKYLADKTKCPDGTTMLTAYQMARKDLESGAVAIEEVK